MRILSINVQSKKIATAHPNTAITVNTEFISSNRTNEFCTKTFLIISLSCIKYTENADVEKKAINFTAHSFEILILWKMDNQPNAIIKTVGEQYEINKFPKRKVIPETSMLKVGNNIFNEQLTNAAHTIISIEKSGDTLFNKSYFLVKAPTKYKKANHTKLYPLESEKACVTSSTTPKKTKCQAN